jgi:hypothetical protein
VDPAPDDVVLISVPEDAEPTTFGLFIERPGANVNNSWPKNFRKVYDEAGGESVLGCPKPGHVPSSFVHDWGPDLTQDLDNGRIMMLDDGIPFVITDRASRAYSRAHEVRSADLLGYPVSNPIPCGTAQIILLDGGEESPGALVSTPTNDYVWLPTSIWNQYQMLGGPRGELGVPIAGNEKAGIWTFEHGDKLSDDSNPSESDFRQMKARWSTTNKGIEDCVAR